MMDKNVRIEVWDEETQSKIRGWTNRETRDFHENRFVVLRNFIPKDIINMTLDTWKTIEANPDYKDAFFHREIETTNNSPKSSLGKSEGCYKFPPAVALHRWLRDNLRDVIDIELVETYSYTRTYDRGAYLKSHTDRPSCEISATICLDYKSDDNTPWKIWVQNDRNYIDDAVHDQPSLFEISQKPVIGKREGCVAVSLEVGDVLLYQGPNIPHWRDTFLGDYSSHMFLHFINANSNMNGVSTFTKPSHAPNDRSQRSAFTYDGAENRYSIEQNNEHFINASNFWENYANRLKVDPSLPPASEIINNYSMIKTPEEKKKK
jgi:hypothetical protein